MKVVAKTILRKGEDGPKTVEIETPFPVGRRINVVYDLPKKSRAVGYANTIEWSNGKALGLFEVTNVFRNTLINPNYTMIELTSKDEEFDKIHPDSKTMLIYEDVVLERVKTIDIKMVEEGFKAGVIQLIESPHADGVVCGIGDNWFYFGGETTEQSTVEDYIRNVPENDIIEEIYSVLNDFEGEPGFNDEYLYYYAHLHEQLKERSVKSVGQLIDDANERSVETQSKKTNNIEHTKE